MPFISGAITVHCAGADFLLLSGVPFGAFCWLSLIALLACSACMLFGVGRAQLLCFAHADWPRSRVDSPNQHVLGLFGIHRADSSQSCLIPLVWSIALIFYEYALAGGMPHGSRRRPRFYDCPFRYPIEWLSWSLYKMCKPTSTCPWTNILRGRIKCLCFKLYPCFCLFIFTTMSEWLIIVFKVSAVIQLFLLANGKICPFIFLDQKLNIMTLQVLGENS